MMIGAKFLSFMLLSLASGLLCGFIREHRKGRIRHLLTAIFGGFVMATADATISEYLSAINIAIGTIIYALSFALGMFIGDALGLVLSIVGEEVPQKKSRKDR